MWPPSGGWGEGVNDTSISGSFSLVLRPQADQTSMSSTLKELSPRPLMLVTGDRAHSRYFSEDVYQKASEPKKLIVVKGATHVDLYDQMDKIPFDEIDNFFRTNLK